jgi:hypothetical protein
VERLRHDSLLEAPQRLEEPVAQEKTSIREGNAGEG